MVPLLACSSTRPTPPWAEQPLAVGESPVPQPTAKSEGPVVFLDNFETYFHTLPDDPIVRQTVERECAAGKPEACRDAGTMNLVGLGGASAPATARDLFETACQLGLEESCSLVGGIYWRGYLGQEDPEQALRWFTEGCRLGNEEDCARAAYMYANGIGHALSLSEAQRFVIRACELGFAELCSEISDTEP